MTEANHRQQPWRYIAFPAICALAIAGCGGGATEKPAEESSTATGDSASTQDSSTSASDDNSTASTDSSTKSDRAAPNTDATPQNTAEPKTPLDAVHAAIDDAHRLLKEEKYREFAEQYAPPEELVRMHETEGAMQQFVEAMKANPQRVAEMTGVLSAIRKLTPKFNKSNTQASFPQPGSGEGKATTPMTVETTDAKLTGFGGELAAAIDKGIETLEAGDIETFVNNMFPAGELRRPDADKRREQIVASMKSNPAPVQKMIADLKALKELQPKLEDSGNVALYEIPGGTIEAGRKTIQLPNRTFKLQKVEDSWRLFDATTPARAEIARQSSLPLPASDHVFVKMIKIGNQWRIQKVNQ